MSFRARRYIPRAERSVAIAGAAFLLGLDLSTGRQDRGTNAETAVHFYSAHAAYGLLSAIASLLVSIVITAAVIQLGIALRRIDRTGGDWQLVAALVVGLMSLLIAGTQIWLALRATSASLPDVQWHLVSLHNFESVRLAAMLGVAAIAIPVLLVGAPGYGFWRSVGPSLVAVLAAMLMFFTPYAADVFAVWAAYTVCLVTGRLDRLPRGTIISNR